MALNPGDNDPRERGAGVDSRLDGQPKVQVKGWRRVVNATRYSALGLRYAWRNESAFRQELTLAVMMAPAAMWLGGSAVERALMVGCLFLVLIVELLNSALEAVVDRIGSEQHRLSGIAKDLGSAAVFISLCNVIAIWGTILWYRIPELLA